MKTLRERFEEKFVVDADSGCWLWSASRHRKGYGEFFMNGLVRKAHRVSFELHVGQIPAGLCVLHRCDTPPCVNPSHLFVGSHAQNMADMVEKGRVSRLYGDKNGARLHPERLPRGDKHGLRLRPDRAARGDKNGSRLHPERLARGDNNGARLYPERLPRGDNHGRAKLTADDVLAIRAEVGLRLQDLALQFGVSQSLISQIRRGKIWTHLSAGNSNEAEFRLAAQRAAGVPVYIAGI